MFGRSLPTEHRERRKNGHERWPDELSYRCDGGEGAESGIAAVVRADVGDECLLADHDEDLTEPDACCRSKEGPQSIEREPTDRTNRGDQHASARHYRAADPVGQLACRECCEEGGQRERGGKQSEEEWVGTKREGAISDHHSDGGPERLNQNSLDTQGPPPLAFTHERTRVVESVVFRATSAPGWQRARLRLLAPTRVGRRNARGCDACLRCAAPLWTAPRA